MIVIWVVWSTYFEHSFGVTQLERCAASSQPSARLPRTGRFMVSAKKIEYSSSAWPSNKKSSSSSSWLRYYTINSADFISRPTNNNINGVAHRRQTHFALYTKLYCPWIIDDVFPMRRPKNDPAARATSMSLGVYVCVVRTMLNDDDVLMSHANSDRVRTETSI